MTSGLSTRNFLAFSRPWPSCSPSYVYQAPAFLTMPRSTPRSTTEPSRLMPRPYMMSNSAWRNGGAHLFLTTFTRVRLPTTSSPSLMASIRRMSRRTEA